MALHHSSSKSNVSAPKVAADIDDFEKLLAEYEAQSPTKEGEIAKGKVIAIGEDYITVDIGYKSEGQIPKEEFINAEGVLDVKVGDEVDVYLESQENDHGQIELSKEKADRLKVWDDLTGVIERDELISGMITGRVKGGLTVDIGIKAFLPGSQVDLRPVRNLEKYIGETYEFKIIKFNKRRGNVVLSRRALLEAERENLKEKTLRNLEAGMTMKGIVKNITEYGCFVDLGGIDGLLHITDMSWGRVSHPADMFEIGTEIEVMVLKFDPKSERVSLGLKQVQEDPWVTVPDTYRVGDRVKGKVVSLTDYGAFIELEPGVEGLIHISEMTWAKRVKHPSKVVNVGDEVEAVILDVDLDAKRISLGMKQTGSNPWEALQERYPVGTVVRGKVRNITNFGLFVGIEDGIDGLVHVSDLSWSNKIKNPADHFQKGDEIEAVVLHIDPDKERFSLGVKQLTRDPWDAISERYPQNSVVRGKVTKILDFGAIIELEDAIEGLVHISELASEKVSQVSDIVHEGQEVNAKVISIYPEERKIGLSLRRLSEEENDPDYAKFLEQQRVESATTIGDVLAGKLAGIKVSD